ncbi:Uncharacterised protein [Bordetella pertussis]|nr:Uncharacterised protein [Bordetella pertussis]
MAQHAHEGVAVMFAVQRVDGVLGGEGGEGHGRQA